MSNLNLRLLALGLCLIALGIGMSPCVGGRAPSPSPGVPHAPRADSEAAPARPLATGASGTVVGGDGGSGPLVDTTPLPEMASGWIPAPASTVTQSALSAVVAQSEEQRSPKPQVSGSSPDDRANISELIAASPWPQSLWGMVACLVERESGGDASAVGLAGERGLMQVHPITWPYLAQYGITPDALFDPATNLRAGYLLFIEAGGLRPWGGECNA